MGRVRAKDSPWMCCGISMKVFLHSNPTCRLSISLKYRSSDLGTFQSWEQFEYARGSMQTEKMEEAHVSNWSREASVIGIRLWQIAAQLCRACAVSNETHQKRVGSKRNNDGQFIYSDPRTAILLRSLKMRSCSDSKFINAWCT
jgi:hypothetical protein